MQTVPGVARAGFNPWLDRKKLLPGPELAGLYRARHRYLRFLHCMFFVEICRKRGQFPYEVRYALRSADRMPLDDVFVVPVRLADCQVPKRIAWNMQYVDLFPDWERESSARRGNSAANGKAVRLGFTG